MTCPTCRTYPRTLAQAFPDVRATWGDEALMSRLRKTEAKAVDTQPEAASAVSEFGHEQPAARRTHPTRLSLWSRILRALRARRIPRGPL